VAERSM